jgi:hypothetical protein
MVAAKGKSTVNKKAMIIMDIDDIDEIKQALDLIYTELSEINSHIRQAKEELEDEDI